MIPIQTLIAAGSCASAGYLFGSIPTAYLVAKYAKGIDIREQGSGNPGATNVYRVVGKTAGIFTFFMDFLKGFLPVQTVLWLLPGWDLRLAALSGVAAIAGHNWPVFLRFKGGKGVATSTGVFFALAPAPTLIAMAVFAVTLLVFQHVSIGSMAGAASLPFSAWFFTGSLFLTGLSVFCALLILFLHKKNIRRLMDREEPKITFGGDNGG